MGFVALVGPVMEAAAGAQKREGPEKSDGVSITGVELVSDAVRAVFGLPRTT